MNPGWTWTRLNGTPLQAAVIDRTDRPERHFHGLNRLAFLYGAARATAIPHDPDLDTALLAMDVIVDGEAARQWRSWQWLEREFPRHATPRVRHLVTRSAQACLEGQDDAIAWLPHAWMVPPRSCAAGVLDRYREMHAMHGLSPAGVRTFMKGHVDHLAGDLCASLDKAGARDAGLAGRVIAAAHDLRAQMAHPAFLERLERAVLRS